ncbi:MAG: hypothetical protein ACREC4_00845 [Methylocella sp.]
MSKTHFVTLIVISAFVVMTGIMQNLKLIVAREIAKKYEALWRQAIVNYGVTPNLPPPEYREERQKLLDALAAVRRERNMWRDQWKRGTVPLPRELIDCLNAASKEEGQSREL